MSSATGCDAENYLYKAPKGLNQEIVEKISEFKSEPTWMRDFRIKALGHFFARKQPTWGSPMLAELDYDDIRYFVRASEAPSRFCDDVPEDVKRTFDRLGIPEAERRFLSGVGAQYESEVVYHQIHEDLERQGVIFTDMETAPREHEEIVRQYFATIIPPNDTEHDLEHLRQVDRQGRRPRVLARAAGGRQGRSRGTLEGRLRRAIAGRALALGHLPHDPDQRGRRQRRPRGRPRRCTCSSAPLAPRRRAAA
jgi:hypothetical protein